MDEWIVNDHPDNRCFGCSAHNPRGLRLRFRHTGPGAVEARYTAPEDFAGAPGVVHGGIQAALLDEALGHAALAGAGAPETLDLVTVDFQLRYRRPAPTGQPLVLFGELERVDGRNLHVRGEIRSEAGEVLTRATARWVHVRPSA